MFGRGEDPDEKVDEVFGRDGHKFDPADYEDELPGEVTECVSEKLELGLVFYLLRSHPGQSVTFWGMEEGVGEFFIKSCEYRGIQRVEKRGDLGIWRSNLNQIVIGPVAAGL